MTRSDEPELSAIIICSHVEPELPRALDQYLQQLAALRRPCELMVVGNGVLDEAADALMPLFQQTTIPCRFVNLHRGCDESTAIRAGVEASRGKLLVLLPPYLQSDPAVLEQMLQRADQGSEYVTTWRTPRVDSWWKRFQSWLFNRVARTATSVPIHDLNSSVRLLTREVADEVPIYGDLHRFWPVLAARQGYRVSEVKTRHLQERVRKGDYRFGVYPRRLLDLLTLFFLIKFTQKPLRFFGLVGSATLGVGALITGTVGLQRLLGQPLADRPLLILGVLLIVLGVQLFSLGLLGELIIFVHTRSRHKQANGRRVERRVASSSGKE